jgi:YD repeat-containing protein
VYDARGNRKTTTLTPKSGSPLSPIVTQASYPASDATETWRCASGTPAVTCNKPITTTDAKSIVTNYGWDSVTGQPVSVTDPAPATGAVRPEKRYSYSSVYAQYLSGGSLVNFATPVTRLTGISECQTTASCSGAADEAKTSVTYGTANALPVSVSSGAGNGTLTATSTLSYDAIGNRLTIDGPLSGTADTTAFRYDLDREQIGVISPDPDGGGALKNRAARMTYNADGQVTKQELGTTAGQTDTAWANFAPLRTVDVTYDTNARPVTQKLSAGGSAFALTQASYDSLGRLDCSAVRMNVAAYGSLPADACTLGTAGSDGPDRITKMAYDAVSRPTKATEAYGSADAADERTLTYSDNGQVATLKDAENNLTTLEYDGFDRASKLRYPVPAKGANASSTTDYEQLTYDANSNVTAFRNRANQTTNFTYDKLDRVTFEEPGRDRARRDLRLRQSRPPDLGEPDRQCVELRLGCAEPQDQRGRRARECDLRLRPRRPADEHRLSDDHRADGQLRLSRHRRARHDQAEHDGAGRLRLRFIDRRRAARPAHRRDVQQRREPGLHLRSGRAACLADQCADRHQRP